LPDFICVGPGRTGTSWLYAVLAPHVCLPRRIKETRFWGQLYHRGVESYSKHFAYGDRARMAGEICPYFPEPLARERIARHIPGCKIIVILRDPVERSYSQYRRFRSRAIVYHSFEQALIKHPRIRETNRYAHHLRGWIDAFGRKSVLVVRYEQLRTDSQRFLEQICAFIGIPSIDVTTIKVGARDVNADDRMPRSDALARLGSRLLELMYRRSIYRGIQLIERTSLYEFFFSGGELYPPLAADADARIRAGMLAEIAALEQLTGFNLSAWKVPRALRVESASEGLAQPLPAVATGTVLA
jgi:hypothetical protein